MVIKWVYMISPSTYEGAQFNFDELFIKRLEQEVYYSYKQMLQL